LKSKIIAVMGPTAAGKTRVAIELARRFGTEVIGADSMQVYRHMRIGTAAPTADEIDAAPHHLVEEIEPTRTFSVAEWLDRAVRIIGDMESRGLQPLIAGGTGLYFRALFEGLFEAPDPDPEIRRKLKERALAEDLYAELKTIDPEAAKNIHPNDTYRTVRAIEIYEQTGVPISEHWKNQKPPREFESLRIGLEVNRKELHRRINERARKMIDDGLVDEVRELKTMGIARDSWPMRHFGYKYIWAHIEGEMELDEALELLARDTRRYARRQLTWFRGVPHIEWFNPGDIDSIIERAENFIAG